MSQETSPTVLCAGGAITGQPELDEKDKKIIALEEALKTLIDQLQKEPLNPLALQTLADAYAKKFRL